MPNHGTETTMKTTQPFRFLLGTVLLATLLLFLTPSVRADKCHLAQDVCMMGTNCNLPKCNCASIFSPNEMKPEDVPQLVVFAFSGPLNKDTWMPLRRIFDNEGKGSKRRLNPNDEPVTMTLFLSDEGTDDYCRAGMFYNDGHEIGVTGKDSMASVKPRVWKEMMMGQRERLAKEAKIDVRDIRGMRAPELEAGGDRQFVGVKLMNYSNWLPYDSSIVLDKNDHLENTVPLWPYTMTFKYSNTIRPWNRHPVSCYPGVWEVPVQRFYDNNSMAHNFIDDWVAAKNVEMLYYAIVKNFWRHYSNNRAPFIINARTDWFKKDPFALKAVERFIDVVLAHDLLDVYVVSMGQMLQWMKDPVPLVEMTESIMFKRPTGRNGSKCSLATVHGEENVEGNGGGIVDNSFMLHVCGMLLMLFLMFVAKGRSRRRRFRRWWDTLLCTRR